MSNKDKRPNTDWDPIEAAQGRWVPRKAPQAKAKPRTVSNPTVAERVRRSGGLGFSQETKNLFGAQSKGILGSLNRAATGIIEVPAKALQLAGHAMERVATGADNAMRSSGLADALSHNGNQFLPASGLMAMAEALPFGVQGATGILNTSRAAAPRVASTARALAADESGAVKLPQRASKAKPKPRAAPAPTREPAAFPKPALGAPRQAQRGALASTATPMEGAPQRIRIGGVLEDVGPSQELRDIARRYAEEAGIDYTPPNRMAQIDEDFSRRAAEAYEAMEHNPSDPKVAAAYQALKDETLAQYRMLEKEGYQFNFLDPANDPYPNPWNAVEDLRENRRMSVYPTDDGFGAGALSDADIANNPLLQVAEGVTWDGKPVRYNDVFRAVHDAMGHGKESVGFRAVGEEAAYQQHLPLYSPLARQAAASELRGQNSWLNYGPHGEANRTATTAETRFADQKIGILPDDIIYGQLEDFLKRPASTPAPDQIAPLMGYAPAYGNLKSKMSLEDRGILTESRDTLVPRQSISPEDLMGGHIMAAQSDKSAAGSRLLGINGERFERPVDLEGGQDYMREQARYSAENGTDNSIWASGRTVQAKYRNRANELGGRVILAPYTMQGTGVDFSTMASDAILQGALRSTGKARGALDEALRDKGFGEFLGLRNIHKDGVYDQVQAQLHGNGGLRKALAETLDNRKMLDAGLPDMQSIRQGLTEPALRDVRTGNFGYTFGDMDYSSPVLRDPALKHGSYDTGLKGTYLGGFDVPVPASVMFPDFYNMKAANPKFRGGDIEASMRHGVVTQKTDQQWLDSVMKYMESAREHEGSQW